MLSTPTPTLAETLANQTFDALLWALTRPGKITQLPSAGEAVIVDALLDRECQAFTGDPTLMPTIMRTGAQISEITDADHVFFGKHVELKKLRQIACGSDLYPDDGSTVILRGIIGQGDMLALTGPGVVGKERIQIKGLPKEFWDMRRDLIRYPMGFELFILDEARVIGIPRSTEIEVL